LVSIVDAAARPSRTDEATAARAAAPVVVVVVVFVGAEEEEEEEEGGADDDDEEAPPLLPAIGAGEAALKRCTSISGIAMPSPPSSQSSPELVGEGDEAAAAADDAEDDAEDDDDDDDDRPTSADDVTSVRPCSDSCSGDSAATSGSSCVVR
jgi:hypothetical protein